MKLNSLRLCLKLGFTTALFSLLNFLDDVFASILTLFMGNGGDQTLPTDQEVIVCDEKTTAEEV